MLYRAVSHHLQQSDEDVSQFDTRFTRQTPVDSPDDTSLSHSAELAFAVSLTSPGLGSRLVPETFPWTHLMDLKLEFFLCLFFEGFHLCGSISPGKFEGGFLV